MLQELQLLQGRYQLQQQLGKNAGRQTWLAEDIEASPGELVIVKLLAFSPQMQWEDFKLFEREAQVLKNLNHPRIPRYRDYFSLDQQRGSGLCWFGLVQDYIPGLSLQQLIDRGKRFSEAQIRQIATDVLQILIDLHALNPPVLHRDIKPSNLILGADGQVYLVDFGAVQNQAAAEGMTFTVVGTTGYAPLEQFWGKAVPASDLYALGATLIHLLTGVSPADLPQKNLRVEFRDRTQINPNLVYWIEALTAPDLTQRYNTAQQALEDLKANRYLNAPLQKIRSPAGSKIKLWHSPTQLKIEIPSRRICWLRDAIAFPLKMILIFSSTMGLFLQLLILVTLGFFGILAAIEVLTNLTGGLVLFVVALSTIIFLNWSHHDGSKELSKLRSNLNQPQFADLKSTYISLEGDSFIIEKRLFGWRYLCRRGQTDSIKKITKNANGVKINTSFETYSFGEGLTETECRWMVEQIKQWLE